MRNALATGSTTQSVDAKTGQVVTRANNANRKTLEAQLNTALQNKEAVDNKIIAANDSITALDMKYQFSVAFVLGFLGLKSVEIVAAKILNIKHNGNGNTNNN